MRNTYRSFFIPTLEDGENVYHYTSAEALKGICENEFWVTESHFLNDSTEFQLGTEIVLEVLSEILNDADLSKILEKALPKEVDESDTLIHISKEYTYAGFYVISFCLDNDSALMWSQYSNYCGYCMEFNLQELVQAFNAKYIYHGKVLYTKEEQKACVKKMIDMALDKRSGILTLPQKNDEEKYNQEELVEFVDRLMYICLYYNMFFKKQCFSGENEYRIVFPAVHDNDVVAEKEQTKQFFRVKNEVLIPYIKKSVGNMDALKAVVIGPKNNSDIAEKGLRCFFRNKKMSVNVSKSEIPLRY
mgnify:CR=1 FL=1